MDKKQKTPLSSLLRQTAFSYVYCFVVALGLSIFGATALHLAIAFIIGVVAIAWDQVNHLVSIDVRNKREEQGQA